MRRRCLSFHAPYRCAHAGACCTAGWPIPLEADAAARLEKAGVVPKAPGIPGIVPARAPGGGSVRIVNTTAAGACVFFDDEGGRLCAIHRDGGPGLMPSACRNFPRVALRDGRGLFVTLSHFCPTAAGLLRDVGRIEIVDAPPGLDLDGTVDGLDATAVMPPLLRPGMLMDLEGYDSWEGACIAVFDDDAYSARAAVRIIADATRDVCRWSPGGETLTRRTRHAFERARTACGPDGAAGPPFQRPLKAFLAAHLFGSWAAYQGGGLFGIVEGVEAAQATVTRSVADGRTFIDAVRSADFRLRHTTHDVAPRPVPALRRD